MYQYLGTAVGFFNCNVMQLRRDVQRYPNHCFHGFLRALCCARTVAVDYALKPLLIKKHFGRVWNFHWKYRAPSRVYMKWFAVNRS